MTETETKAEEVRAELYPLSKTEFETLYDKAWENGWVYGKFFQELYDEYLVNWVYFVDYLDVLKGVDIDERMYKRIQDNFVIVTANNQKPILIEAKDFYLELFPKKVPEEKVNEEVEEQEPITDVEILIGEAPPYWKGNADNEDKSYFYNPAQTKNSSWLNVPFSWKGGKLEDTKINAKQKKLEFLAKKGIVLIDIFPFPIIQDPKVRTEITGGYAYHIENYFLKKYSEIINYIDTTKRIKFTHGLVATELGALQFLCDKSIFLLDGYSDIVNSRIEFQEFTCIESWIENINGLNPNDKNKPCDRNLISHYKKYEEYYIPIVKYSSKNDKTDWSDKLKFVLELLGDKVEKLDIKDKKIIKDEISVILDRITKLPIFMKGQNVVFKKVFINGSIK